MPKGKKTRIPKLTQKQKEFFENLKNHYGLKALSSYEKIKEIFGFKSKNSIKQYIEALKKEDLIIQNEDKLYINPNQFGAPLILTSVIIKPPAIL